MASTTSAPASSCPPNTKTKHNGPHAPVHPCIHRLHPTLATSPAPTQYLLPNLTPPPPHPLHLVSLQHSSTTTCCIRVSPSAPPHAGPAGRLRLSCLLPSPGGPLRQPTRLGRCGGAAARAAEPVRPGLRRPPAGPAAAQMAAAEEVRHKAGGLGHRAHAGEL